MIEDLDLREDLCRATFRGSTGIEWICKSKPHGKIYKRKASDKNHSRGGVIFDNSPRVDRHYFVNRWPNRIKE